MKTLSYTLKKRVKHIAASTLRYVFLIAFSYTLIYPVIFMISSMLKSSLDYFDPTVQWVPKTWSLESIGLAVKALDFWKSICATLINEVVAALLSVASCMVTAYGLARFNFKYKNVLMGILFLTMLVPPMITVIPNYVNFRYLDFFGILGFIGKITGLELRPSILNTPLVFYLPSILSVGLKNGFFIFIYHQFFKGLPKELEEAAWIDGAGAWKTFLRVILPSSGTSIVTVLLFAVVWYWNDSVNAGMFIDAPQTLRVNLAHLFGNASTDLVEGITSMNRGSVIMAAFFLAIVPLLIFYVIIQRKFISSIVNSGIVG